MGGEMADTAQDASEKKEQYTPGHTGPVTRWMQQRTAASHAAFFTPHLKPGMRLLDCGCGPGSITLGLARLAAPGETVGIDMAENQLEEARLQAARQGVDNVRFENASVYELPFADKSFDAVFSHAVLEHLAEPKKALAEMHRVLRPGGVFGIRDADRAGEIFWPADPALLRFHELWDRWAQHNGGNPFFGRQLRSLLNGLGLERVTASAGYENHGAAEAIKMTAEALAYYNTEILSPRFVEQGWLEHADADAVTAAWLAWGDSRDAFWGRSWCEAVGWKT
jgi:SAM-dependent methyltransferase